MTMQAMPMMMPTLPAQSAGGPVATGGKAVAGGDDLFGQLLAETGLAAADLKTVLAALPAACRQKLDLAVPGETEVPATQPLLEEQSLVESGLLALLTATDTAPLASETNAELVDVPALPVAAPEVVAAEVVAAEVVAAEVVVVPPVVPAELLSVTPQALPEGAPTDLPQAQVAPMMTAALAETVPTKGGEPAAKVVPGHLKQEMDQRFARLLQPESQAKAQALPLRGAQLPQAAAEAAPVVPEQSTAMPQPAAQANPAAQLLAGLHQPEGRSNPAVDSLQPTLQGISPQPQAAMSQPTVAEPMLTLASGQQLPEAAVVQQVVTHLSGSPDGESGKMVLRLKPAELGELKIELVMEGDRLKAHLHAQSQQVQEVLERHMPQLREALQQKGLQMDDFRVSVDSGREQGQAFQQQARQEAQRAWGSQGYRPESPFGELEEMAIPLYRANHPGGINVHV